MAFSNMIEGGVEEKIGIVDYDLNEWAGMKFRLSYDEVARANWGGLGAFQIYAIKSTKT